MREHSPLWLVCSIQAKQWLRKAQEESKLILGWAPLGLWLKEIRLVFFLAKWQPW